MAHTASLAAIWAQSLNAVIGLAGGMPWYAPEDLKHFKELTLGCPVLMGRKTWDSFPQAFRPLPGRQNIVVSSRVGQLTQANGALWAPSLDRALLAGADLTDQRLWLIGGASLFEQALTRKDLPGVTAGCVSTIERTVFAHRIAGDSYAPSLDDSWELVSRGPYSTSARGWIEIQAGKRPRQNLEFRFESWQRKID